MKKSLTHPVLQVIIIKATKIWLEGDSPSAQDITLENEEYEDAIFQAHTNQKMQLDGTISSKDDYQSGGAKYNRAIKI